MNMKKRDFLKNLASISLASLPASQGIQQLLSAVPDSTPKALASNEAFWAKIRADYKLKPDYINLENGYYCMIPEPTLEKLIQNMREVNYQASYYMRTVRFENKKKVANALADMADCNHGELIVTRNATESLDTIIAGFPWQAGDEAVMAHQDYGAMQNMFRQVENRQGINVNVIDVPMYPKNDEEVVAAYEAAISPKTKLLMVCHIINITGHILPIRKICDMAHSKGVEVMVDGAHAFGQFQFSIKELDCDYYGTSLHKWLSAPLGAGFLFVKREKVDQIWPLMAEGKREPGDISRLNHIGTHPCHTDLTILDAIAYQNAIGGARKEERLRFIQRYWSEKARKMEHVVVNTPADPKRSCAIANVGIKGMKPSDMADILLKKYNIWTVAIDGAGVKGCRISPNVYTSLEELDTFVAALEEMKV